MSIPLNGRIAVVDDNINQVYPLIELFGKQQNPFLYYKGNDLRGLPDEGKAFNDIRLLFLDIFLAGDALTSDVDKRIKSTLISVISRIISDNNYPYLLIFWSRHEDDYGKIVREIFKNELKAKAPIDFLSAQKSDYFDLTGQKTEKYDENVAVLFARIRKLLAAHPIFYYLLQWENNVHLAADNALEEIFSVNSRPDNWDANSQFLFYKLASAYAGKNLKGLEPEQQIRNGLFTLNSVFSDSLEHSLNVLENKQANALVPTKPENSQIVCKINRKLLFSDDVVDKLSPGIVFVVEKGRHNFGGLLNSAIIRQRVFEKKTNKEAICSKIKDIEEKLFKKEKKKIESEIFEKLKAEIESTWLTVETNVTPMCDFAQGKEEYPRILPGLFIKSQYKEYVDTRTEALFVSPDFLLQLQIGNLKIEGEYFFLLDFRFFTSIQKKVLGEMTTPILRIRQQLIAEIQSKLSRHVNRQGVLFLDIE